ncbi:MAG: hypothetical protein LBO66_15015 [Deltaproteobacteria bacterium]|jgi:DNA-directed RNA polymerase subunit RPC12/RpoP|nr:hypothetical protein [Deltaproteobacteria bacterium]
MKIPCPHCGSTNVTVLSHPPTNSKFLNFALGLLVLLKSRGLPRGKRYVICRDCGHRTTARLN